jgi:hypothetical protein
MAKLSKQHGYSILEFLIVVPILIGVVVAVLDLSKYMQVRSAVRQATQIALRCLYTTDGECTAARQAPTYTWERQVIREQYEEQLYDYDAIVPTIIGPEYHYSEFTARVLDSLLFTVNAPIDPILIGGTNQFRYQYWEQIAPIPEFSAELDSSSEGVSVWRTPSREREWGEAGKGVARWSGEQSQELNSRVAQSSIVARVFSMPQFPSDTSMPCLARCNGVQCEPCTLSKKLPLVVHVQGDHHSGEGAVLLEMAITSAATGAPSSNSPLWQSLGGQLLKSKPLDTGTSEASFIPRGATRWKLKHGQSLPAEAKEDYNKKLSMAPQEQLWIRVSLDANTQNLRWSLRGVAIYFPEYIFQTNQAAECFWTSDGSRCLPALNTLLTNHTAELEKGITERPVPPSRECPDGRLYKNVRDCGVTQKSMAPIQCRENKGIPIDVNENTRAVIAACNPEQDVPEAYVAMRTDQKNIAVPVDLTIKKRSCADDYQAQVLAASGGYHQIVDYKRTATDYVVSHQTGDCQTASALPAEYACEGFSLREAPMVAPESGGILSGSKPGYCDWEQRVTVEARAIGADCVTPKATASGTGKTYKRPMTCGNVKIVGVEAEAVAGWQSVGTSTSKDLPPDGCKTLEERCALSSDTTTYASCLSNGDRYSCRVTKEERAANSIINPSVAEQLATDHLKHAVPWVYAACEYGGVADILEPRGIFHQRALSCPSIKATAASDASRQVALHIDVPVMLNVLRVLDVLGGETSGQSSSRLLGQAHVTYDQTRDWSGK